MVSMLQTVSGINRGLFARIQSLPRIVPACACTRRTCTKVNTKTRKLIHRKIRPEMLEIIGSQIYRVQQIFCINVVHYNIIVFIYKLYMKINISQFIILYRKCRFSNEMKPNIFCVIHFTTLSCISAKALYKCCDIIIRHNSVFVIQIHIIQMRNR